LQTLFFVTLNVVICDPTFWKKGGGGGGHEEHQPKGVWQKKLVWKEDWVQDFKVEKQEIWKTEHKKIQVPVWKTIEVPIWREVKVPDWKVIKKPHIVSDSSSS
jgi:hypothetical protein